MIFLRMRTIGALRIDNKHTKTWRTIRAENDRVNTRNICEILIRINFQQRGKANVLVALWLKSGQSVFRAKAIATIVSPCSPSDQHV